MRKTSRSKAKQQRSSLWRPSNDLLNDLVNKLEQAQCEIGQRDKVAQALDKVVKVVDNQSHGQGLMAEIAEIARSVTNTDAAQIFLLEDDGQTLTLVADTSFPEKAGRVSIKLGQGLTGWAAQFRRAVAIPREPWNDPRFFDYPGLDEAYFQSILCVPLIASDELIGVVNVRTRRAYDYSAGEAYVLARIAEQIARAIHHQTHVATLESQARRYQAISEVGQLIAGNPYMEEILQLLVSFTAERLNYRVVTVRLLDESRGELVLRATQSENRAYRRKRAILMGESIAGRAVLEKKIITVEDVQSNPEYIGADLAEEQGLRSMACVPLLIRDKAIGVMSCYTSDKRQFSRAELAALEALAKHAAIAIEHAKLQVRTTLMQEMHHRLKNNLQQVVSILRLQLSEGENKSVQEVINESLSRIQTIASVHDLLTREDLDRVGLRTIAETLATHLQQSFILPKKRITIDVTGVDEPLRMTQATQVALIINELLLNAIEHGFQNSDEGEIYTTLVRKGDDIVIWVVNSGDKLPIEFDLEVDSHLGLKIVDRLARGVRGRFSLEQKFNWVVAEVHIPRQLLEDG